MNSKIEFGVMYHITGHSPAVWADDFKTLAESGFSRVVLADFNHVFDDVVAALDLCEQAGLRAYYVAYGPGIFYQYCAAEFDKHPELLCVGIDGATLQFQNPYLAEGRQAILVPYLQRIAEQLGDHPALAGYFIDDTMDAESTISYTAADAVNFRGFVREKYGDLAAVNSAWESSYAAWEEITPPRIMLTWRAGWRAMWHEWCDARESWWLGWADDVVTTLRQHSANYKAGGLQVILGDDWYSLRFGRDVAGGYTPAMVARFDSFSFDYTAGIGYLDPAMTNIDRDVAMAHDLAGAKDVSVFLKAGAPTGQPLPSVRDIVAQSERVLANGVTTLDYYIYRACPGNYAERNGLADNPEFLRELAAWVRSVSA
jgi:hypothetical protein